MSRITEVLKFEGNKVDYDRFYHPKRTSIVYHADAYEFQKRFIGGKLDLEQTVNCEVDRFTINFRNINIEVRDRKFEDTERVGVNVVISYTKISQDLATKMKKWFEKKYKNRLESFKEPWKREMDKRDYEARL